MKILIDFKLLNTIFLNYWNEFLKGDVEIFSSAFNDSWIVHEFIERIEIVID